MNDWQEIIGGTWYSSSPFLLHRNHNFNQHQSRRFDSAHNHRGSNNSLVVSNGNGNAAAGGTGLNNNTRRVRSCIFSKRWLFFFLFHLGCLAMDHSTRELSYEEEEVRLLVDSSAASSQKVIKIISGGNNEREHSLASSENSILSFHPSSLDFKDSPVGVPQLGLVRVENRLNDENVKLISISGSTIHFHSSFFADKNIPPGGNTTFEIVFLSRVEGRIESNLYIHTSKGLFKFQVQGYGLPNPYRLKPLVGARIPINGSYEPLITIHNPHGDSIQVTEMLSSDTDFSLSLPDDVPEDGEGLAWAIEPFQTKSLMKGSFLGKQEGNHTGYIKIRVNSSSAPSPDYLLVPIEVQVSSRPGIYSPQDCLDFGLMVKTDKPRTLSLSLINAHEVTVNVQSITVRGHGNPAVKIEFRPLSLEPDNSVSTVVTLITFDPSKIRSLKDSHGYIEIQCDTGDSLSVPFRTNFLQGQFEYNSSALGFFVKANQILPRNFSIRNTFTSAAVIYDVSVSHPEIVDIEQLNHSQILSPGECKEIFTLRVHKKVELCETQVELTVKSNITSLKLPLTCYDGKLNLHIMDPERINFGRIELLSTHIEYFSVDNLNPVEIRLKSWTTNCTSCSLELIGMQNGKKEDLSRIQDFDGLKKSLFLQPNHLAVFSVEVRRYKEEGEFWAEAVITTDHNQTIRVPFYFSVWKGAIRSDLIAFDRAFPGKVSKEKLHLTSTFNVTMNVRGVKAALNSPMWFTTNSQDEYPEIPPNGRNHVGKVHFDAGRLCGCDCYAGFYADSSIGRSWVSGMNVSWNTGEDDWHILKRLQKRYDQVKDASFSNMSLWVETSTTQGPGYKIKTRITYTWPRLTSNKSTTVPLTALGNESVMELPITNPSSSPLIVQALLAIDYGPLWSQFIQGQSVAGNVTDGNSVFQLDGVRASSHANESVATFTEHQLEVVSSSLNIHTPIPGVVFLLPAGNKYHLRIKFNPTSKEMASTMLLLRNNLTGIETTWLKGRAGIGQLTLGNGLSGSPLQFQITERLLQGCNSREIGFKTSQPPQLTVRRSFIARNIGEIPLNIKFLDIFPSQETYWAYWFYSEMPSADENVCEGYGYRILNCQPFSLLPNQTHSLDIAFSPDFTMSKSIQTLRLTDSSGIHFNFSLTGMVPNSMLPVCTLAIPRPVWEIILKYLLLAGILLAAIAALIMGYVEATTMISGTVLATVRVVPEESVDLRDTCKLDLKEVYEKVDNRFKRNQIQQQANQSQSRASHASTSPASINHAESAKSGSTGEPIVSQSNSVVIASSSQTGANHLNSSSNNVVRNRKKNKINNNLPTELNLNHSSSSSPPEKQSQQKPDKPSTPPSSTAPSVVSLTPISTVSPPKTKQDKQDTPNTKTTSSSTSTPETTNPGTPIPTTSSVADQPAVLEKLTPASSGQQNRQSNSNNSKRKRKQQRNQQRRNNSKPSVSPVLNESPSPSASPSPKAEEETSSTTTESSNSEELNSLLAERDEKERKLSGKSNESECEQVSATEEYETWNKKGKGKSWKNNSNSKANQNQGNNNKNVVVGLPKAIDDLGKQGGWQKKKELSGSSSSGSRGSLSPKQDLSSAWDTPRPSSGLSERSSHMEFGSQKSGKRGNMVAPTPVTGTRLSNTNIGGQRSPPTTSQHHIQIPKQYQPSYLTKAKQSGGGFEVNSASSSSTACQPSKAVGVIGERPPHLRNPSGDAIATPTYPGYMVPPNQTGQLGDCFINAPPGSNLVNLMNNPTAINAAEQYKANLPQLNSAWGNEIFDNGYEFWKRKVSSDASSMANVSSNNTVVSLASGNSGFATNRQNYFRPVANIPVSASPGNPYSSQQSSSSVNLAGVRTSPTGTGQSSSSTPYMQASNPAQLSELISNFWRPPTQVYAGNFERDSPPTSTSGAPGFSPPLFSYYNQSTGQYQPAQQHNNLLRQRSEPSSRFQGAAGVPSGGVHGFNGGFSGGQHSQLKPTQHYQGGIEAMSTVAEDSNNFGWPPTSVAVSEPSSWTTSTTGSTEPTWPSLATEHKWSRTEEKPPALNVEALAVGAGNRARINNTPPFSHTPTSISSGLGFADSHSRPPLDVAQSQREVEAGLGFNPFKTDIWNQGDSPGWAFSNNTKTD